MLRKFAAAVIAVILLLTAPLVATAADHADNPAPAPQESASCPTPQGMGNDGVIGVIGGAVDSIPGIGDVAKVLTMIGTIAGTFLSWIADPGRMAHDIVTWFTWHLLGYSPDTPQCYQPTSAYGVVRSVFLGDVQLDASSVYADGYNALAAGSAVLVIFAAMLRVARAASDRQAHALAAVIDVLPRVVLGLGGIALGFPLLSMLLPLFTQIGASMFGTLAGIFVGEGSVVHDPLGLLLFTGLARVWGMGLVALLLAPVLLYLLLRMIMLLIARFLVVSFGVVFTPLVIAIAVFDHDNRAVRWWWSMMAGAAITPVVCGSMIGVTVGLSMRFAQGDQSVSSLAIGPLVGGLIVIGGLWLTGRTIRTLLFHDPAGEHGSMGGFLRHSFEAAVALPLAAAALAGPAAVGAALPGRAAAAVNSMVSQRSMGNSLVAALVGAGQHGSSSSSAPSARPSTAGAGSAAASAAGAFAAFRSSPAGEALGLAAAGDRKGATVSPAQAWAAIENDDAMAPAVNRLRTAAFASQVGTGKPVVSEHDRARFLADVADAVAGGEPAAEGGR